MRCNILINHIISDLHSSLYIIVALFYPIPIPSIYIICVANTILSERAKNAEMKSFYYENVCIQKKGRKKNYKTKKRMRT